MEKVLAKNTLWKEISPAPLVSMVCAYNGAMFISRAKYSKDKMDFITGIVSFGAMIANTIAFIIK